MRIRILLTIVRTHKLFIIYNILMIRIGSSWLANKLGSMTRNMECGAHGFSTTSSITVRNWESICGS
jgi:hypothetical protein